MGVGGCRPEVVTYFDGQAPGGMREIELPISSIVNLGLAVQLWLRGSGSQFAGRVQKQRRIECCLLLSKG